MFQREPIVIKLIENQLISNKNKYKFDPASLTYVEVKVPVSKKIGIILLNYFSISAVAIAIIFLIHFMLSLSGVNLFASQIHKQIQKYQQLVHQADSLALVLKTNLFVYDKIYREILQMDSLPDNIRYAGFGGAIPFESQSFSYSNQMYSGLNQKINNLKSQIKVQDESYSEIFNQAIERNRKLECFPGITPVDLSKSIFISSKFGSRDDPFTFNLSLHPGIDFSGELNTKVYSTAKGTVTFAEQSRTGYGNEILIDHGFGYITRYAHLNKILVSRGQKVKRGQLIGLMGNTGRSTGTHLHYEVRFFGTPVNPAYFYSDNLTPKEYEKLTKN